ncbi:hypothetical protein QCD58_004602 [Enterobacter hormaechei]|nr:hypothetical protein [Enterobacter hormaechei]
MAATTGPAAGGNAKITTKLTYLWESCTGELKHQTNLFRFHHAIETAKDMYWICDREWSGRHAVALNAGVNAEYLSINNLDAALDDDGHQVKVLIANITGNVAGFATLLGWRGWSLEHQDAQRYHLWAKERKL